MQDQQDEQSLTPPIPTPRPMPRPSAGRVPRPQPPAAATPEPPAPTDPASWGRVADDGTVYVRVADGERPVGQYPEGTPAEALAFFAKRFDALAFEVQLLEQRITAGTLGPDEARTSIKQVREQVTDAAAVGDLDALQARLDALAPLLEEQRAAKRAERKARLGEAKDVKERIVGEAEQLATGHDWRNGANRLRELLDEWKAAPRLDRATDDQLWHRFSSARTTYTRARKHHFSELGERREGAKATKERLVKEAESISDSTEWGPTAGRYRSLMQDWKAAGSAAKSDDDALWARFRAAQDRFFGARDAANAAQDREFEANAQVKELILVEAEALVPVSDLDDAKRRFRDLADRWDAAGKVPRGRIKELEGRMRKVEQAIRGVEDEQWRRTDPEKSARAEDMVSQLEEAIAGLEADLEKARSAGEAKRAAQIEDNLVGRRQFLEMARKVSADYS